MDVPFSAPTRHFEISPLAAREEAVAQSANVSAWWMVYQDALHDVIMVRLHCLVWKVECSRHVHLLGGMMPERKHIDDDDAGGCIMTACRSGRGREADVKCRNGCSRAPLRFRSASTCPCAVDVSDIASTR